MADSMTDPDRLAVTEATLEHLDSVIGELSAMRIEAVQVFKNAQRALLDLDERIDEAMREQRELVERLGE